MNNLKVRFTEIVVGSGALAEGKVWVRVRTRMFLNRGDEVKGLWGNDDYGMGFFLQDREIIAGLRYATEGMRVGGRRKVTIPPHLAFREIGLQEMIPPNALLRGELELLDVRQPGEEIPMPSKELQGSALSITAWDEESSRLPRWHLVFHDRKHSYYASQCNLMLEWSTRSDGKWGSRSAQRKSVSLIIDEREIEWMIETGKQLPSDHSSDCLHHGEVHSHGGHSPTKSNSDSIICWHISSVENGKYQGVCYLRKNSPLWTQTDWGRNIMALVQPYLTEAPWRQKASERNPSVS